MEELPTGQESDKDRHDTGADDSSVGNVGSRRGGEFASVAGTSDDRALFDWESRWPKRARWHIRFELLYLVALFAASPVGLFCLSAGKLDEPLDLTTEESRSLALYGAAWFGGLLGGCLFSMKWLYHSVARGKWHLDRRPWRFLTPLVSAGLAFGTMALFISGALPIFSDQITGTLSGVAGVSFLVGYFSDDTVAALAAAASKLLRGAEEQSDGSDSRN
ncbi:MAG TPA: hypothetical protein VFG42_21505 [Baekduia sp.]|uniref:hypothetical protein n=1 Tax=Baekduia sp. TaxID=2600305 RepID=UPI002D773AEF|nr:hypothetical protein [Baekduia sp.]HET6509389.1 hypothetical protein [Baekduia sp.]